MAVGSLKRNKKDALAREIALCCYKNMPGVYKDTGTFLENCAPDFCERGERSVGDFVGWTGIIPITMLIEDVFGIEVNSKDNEIVWHINELSRHGIKNLPFGKDSEITLICEKRNSEEEKPDFCSLPFLLPRFFCFYFSSLRFLSSKALLRFISKSCFSFLRSV